MCRSPVDHSCCLGEYVFIYVFFSGTAWCFLMQLKICIFSYRNCILMFAFPCQFGLCLHILDYIHIFISTQNMHFRNKGRIYNFYAKYMNWFEKIMKKAHLVSLKIDSLTSILEKVLQLYQWPISLPSNFDAEESWWQLCPPPTVLYIS